MGEEGAVFGGTIQGSASVGAKPAIYPHVTINICDIVWETPGFHLVLIPRYLLKYEIGLFLD